MREPRFQNDGRKREFVQGCTTTHRAGDSRPSRSVPIPAGLSSREQARRYPASATICAVSCAVIAHPSEWAGFFPPEPYEGSPSPGVAIPGGAARRGDSPGLPGRVQDGPQPHAGRGWDRPLGGLNHWPRRLARERGSSSARLRAALTPSILFEGRSIGRGPYRSPIRSLPGMGTGTARMRCLSPFPRYFLVSYTRSAQRNWRHSLYRPRGTRCR
jgi:hypothetical protein